MPLDSVPQPPLVFAGIEIPGIVIGFTQPPPATQLFRRHFCGIVGESELRGGIGGRTLEIPVLLAGGFDSRDAIVAFYAQTLNQETIQVNDTLVYSPPDGADEVFPFSTFLGFHPDPRGPREDVAGTIDGGWFIYGTLLFRQLLV
jgi:hypothetical protein